MNLELTPQTGKKVSAGKFYPLGASLYADGVNFAIYSKHAKEVFLFLFDSPDGGPTDIIRLEDRDRFIWHVFVHGIKEGQLYGYKVRGEYDPAHGMRFNEHKLLMDPYAKALSGKFKNSENLLLGYDAQLPEKDLAIDTRDNTSFVPKSIVIDNSFDWQGDVHPDIPCEKLVIYEVHLKGFTAHGSSGVKNPGTYLGFTEKIPYLKDLGINGVELLPLQEFYMEDSLLSKGLTNYWGYNTVGFFAPESSYSTQGSPGCQVNEFKILVRELHRANIEVIMDVVYNHSGEGNELGPTICLKGVDNPTFYRLTGPGEEPYRYYKDYTGCGNSLNLENPHVMGFVMDSLRHWVQEMHVDGFRFDLASALGREEGRFQKSASFFDAISQDPVLNKVKIIAEPWDIETYQLGNFPVDWSEWNGRFRDTVRRFIKGDAGQLKQLGWRLTGSADLYKDDGRSPYNSVNFVTSHDGFTMRDLVSYDEKHNEANLEENKDGSNENLSWNCGAEGETDDENIVNLRRQMIKNFFCSLFFSLGTPMMLGGDEFMRTQKGNNNTYCQDNEISWFNWDEVKRQADIYEFCKKAIAFRKKYSILQRRKFFSGKDTDEDNVPDIAWYGEKLKKPVWNNPELRTICYQLDGGEEESGLGHYHLFFIFNADVDKKTIMLPQVKGKKWLRVVDTSINSGEDFLLPGKELPLEQAEYYLVNPRCTVVLLSK